MGEVGLAWRALGRDWRAGELRVLGLALVIAVASVAAVGLFTDRVGRIMERQSAELLGGDLVVRSPAPIDPGWETLAETRGLTHARTLTMRSVILAGDATQLTELKAVSPGYPLRGALQVADAPFAEARATDGIPGPGEVWLEVRALQGLGVSVGDPVEVGGALLHVGAILAYEPDRGGDFFSIAPRLMMNLADMPATGLVQPGSRVQHRLLIAGEPAAVDQFRATAEDWLTRNERLEGVRDARPELRQALERAERFLGLAALVSVVIAGVGVAISARRFAERHWDSAAIMRCVGATQGTILRLYLLELLMLGLAAGVAGLLLGYLAQYGLAAILARLATAADLPPPGLGALPVALGTGFVTLFGFALPPLLRLRRVAPLRVLRRDLDPMGQRAVVMYGLPLLAVALLVTWQAGDGRLAAWVLGGAGAAAFVLGLAARLLVFGLNGMRGRVGVAWRFGLANIARRGATSSVQVVALGLGIMVLLVLTLVRADLLQGWQASLPPDAPNHFLINIQPNEVEGVRAQLAAAGVDNATLYPMVRGRLVAIGGRPVVAGDFEETRTQRLVEREFNLSWMGVQPEHNTISAGRWWTAQEHGQGLVSVERGLAERLGVGLGDEMRFLIAGQEVSGRVQSLRSVNWDSFKVNFFVVFPPGVIEQQPATWITSVHLTGGQRPLLADLIRTYPSVTVIDVDALMSKIREIMERVVLAVEYVFLFTLLAGLVVLHAAIQATQDARRFEGAMLRTLGASRQIVRQSLVAEFGLLGLLAGLLAAVAATGVGYGLARGVFEFPYQASPWVWLIGAAGGALGVGFAGWLGTRDVVRQPPMVTLRSA